MKHTQIITPVKSMLSAFMVLFLIFIGTLRTLAQDLKEVSPITNKILLLYVEEGHMDTYGSGQTPADIIAYVNPVNISSAMNLSNYSLSSTDDTNYSSQKNPINIGRKSKGIDFNNEGAAKEIALGHWIYIELPQALQQGKTYTLSTRNVVENVEEVKFTFDVNSMRSETIHVNQVGFPTNAPKYAYLSQWMGDFNTSTHTNGGLELDDYSGAEFRVVNFNTGATVYTGTIEKRLDKTSTETFRPEFGPDGNYTKADVWQCDFSAVTSSGEYIIVVDRIGKSFPFEIGNDITKEPFYYAMKGLFWQRQGVFKEQYDGKVMPADHTGTWRWDDQWNPGDSHSTNGFDNSRAKDVNGIYGYYFDAGDWDGYFSHNRVPMALLLLYDLTPDRYKDGEVGNRYKRNASDPWIDEGSNGLPDLLDEASWLVNYGKRARSILDANGGTGGVPLYVGRDGVPNSNGVTAWNDTRTWYIARQDPRMTFFHSGNAAYYAICLNEFHKLTNSGNHPDAAGWIAEAESAFQWSENNRDNTSNDAGNNERRARGYAAAALYRATGKTQYQTIFKDIFNWDPWKGGGEWSNPNTTDIAASLYALTPNGVNGLDTAFRTVCINYVIKSADDNKVQDMEDNGYRQPIENNQFAQLGGINTPRMTMVPVAYELTGNEKYLDLMHHASSYVLGGNQLNMVYLSGLGERYDDWIFQPNAYLTSDYNSKVYSSENFIGQTSYFTTTPETGYWFFQSIFSEYYSQKNSYPDLRAGSSLWPGTERKTYNRFSIQGGEFTVHQQNNYMIYTLGYVKAKANPGGSNYRLNDRPTVSLNLNDGQDIDQNRAVLTVNASSDTRYVDYYYEWHYIGRSEDKNNNFRFEWDPLLAPGTEVLITAVSSDDRGRISLPTGAGDKTVKISGTFISVDSVSVTPESANVTLGRTLSLTATVSPVNASNDNVSWSSSNTNVATVDENGTVTAVGLGSTDITATTEDGNKTDSTTITVVNLTCDPVLTNPSFEDGLTSWITNSGTPITSSDAVDGNNSIQLTGESGVEQQFTQSLQSGKSVIVRFSAKVNATIGWSGVGFDFKDATDTTIEATNTQITNATWQEFVIQGNAPAGTEIINVWFYTSSDILNVDDFCVDIENADSGPDTQAPSVPSGLASSAITETSFVLDWNASTDNVGVDEYSIYIDGVYNKRSTDTNTTVSGLSANTTYAVTVSARDAAGNESSRSTALSVTTSGSGGNPGVSIDIEAEEFTAQSGTSIQSVGSWFTGTGYVDYGGNNSYAEWTVDLTGSSADLEFRYTNGSGDNRVCDLLINGTLVGTVDFPPSGGWGTPTTTTFIGATISEGTNVIRLVANNAFSGGPNLDRLSLNTTGGSEPGGDYTQDDNGLVSMEAEGATSQSNGSGTFASMSWQQQNDATASNGSFMIVPDNGNINSAGTLNGPRLDFEINFVKTGTHYIWVRQKSPNGADNSIIPAFDGVLLADWNMPDALTEWTWSKAGFTFDVTSTGIHTFSIYMREDATPIDKIELTTNTNYAPSDTTNGLKVQIDMDANVSIYPNPVNAELHVQFKSVNKTNKRSVDLYSFNGILLNSQRFTAEQSEVILDTSDLQSGIYVLKITEGKQSIEYKVIKE